MTPSAPPLAISLFGHPRLTYGGEPFALGGRRKVVPLLCFLLLHREDNLARDFVAFSLFPDEEEDDARTRLRSTIHDLSHALPGGPEGGWTIVTGTNLRWNPAANYTLDVAEFERDVAAGDVDAAVERYQADLLEGVHEEWLYGERERLRNLLLGGLERGIARARRAGDLPHAIGYAQRLLGFDPYREDVVRRSMSLRNESGDRSGALAEYRRFERLIRDELGVDPMPETQALRAAIARDELTFEAPDGDAPEAPALGARAAPATFVGRERELAKLRDAWTRVRRRNGTLTFLGGEAGIGKTALVAHFARDVADGGGRVLVGTTSAPETVPYECAIAALRGALPLVSALRLAPVWTATLSALIPELDVASDGAALPDLQSNAQGDRVREAIARAIVALAETRPLLLVLEDLHWASAATLALVGDLLRRVGRAPVAVIVTYRNDEVPRTHPLARLIRESLSNPSVAALPLGPLERDDIAALLERNGASAERADAVYEISRGNAFFATQVVHAGTADRDVPPNVREFVAQRIGQLPQDARHVAEIAALLGAQFSRECVREVSGWSEAEVGAALDELMARRFVRERSGGGAFDFAFAHQFVCDALETLAPGTPDRHRRVARVLEECHPALANDLAAKIATHYERAGEAREAIRCYTIAADRALDLGSQADAERAIERGLALCVDARTRIELLKRSLEASSRSDIPSERATVDRLETLARELDDGELLDYLLLHRAESASRLLFNTEAQQTLAAVRARANETRDERMSVFADYFEGRFDILTGGRTGLGIPLLERAMPALEKYRDLQRIVRASSALLAAYQRLGDAAGERRELARLRTLEDPSMPYEVRISVIRAPFAIALERVDPIATEQICERWIEAAERAGDLRESLVARESLAWPLLMKGRCGQALASVEAAVELLRRTGAGGVNVATQTNYALVLTRIGDFATARETMEASGFDRLPEIAQGIARSTNALLGAFTGDFAFGRENGLRSLAINRANDRNDRLASCLENLVELERRAGDFEASLAYAREALEVRAKFSGPGRLRPAAGAALAAAHLGRHDEARALLAQIGDGANTLDATYWRDRFALQVAHAWHLGGDGAAAERWLATAEAEAATVLADLPAERVDAYEATCWMREIRSARAGDWTTFVAGSA